MAKYKAITDGAAQVRDTRPAIGVPADAVRLLLPNMIGETEQETMRVLCLNNKNRVLEDVLLYRGTVNTINLRVGELFRAAIRCGACAIIVAHNHPSGDATPSPEDIQTTRSLVEAGKLLDVEVLDHVIIGAGSGNVCSMRERRLGF